MSQVAGIDSARNGKLEVSTNGSSWTDISGMANTLVPSGGEYATAETYTMDGLDPATTIGKRTALVLTCTAVFTEGAGEVFAIVQAVYDAGSDLYVRWSPRGGQTGEKLFTTGAGKVVSINWPGIDAASAESIKTGFVWRGKVPVVSTAA